jgi:uncharacterized membrane protein YeaQ/YmgE (transglycosylase-associated protein family)
MPFANLILILLIGLVLGVIASVVLKCRGLTFFVNILLGILGGCIGAFAPVIFGNALLVDISTPGYLLRALLGAFLIVLLASLFRPIKPRSAQ